MQNTTVIVSPHCITECQRLKECSNTVIQSSYLLNFQMNKLRLRNVDMENMIAIHHYFNCFIF